MDKASSRALLIGCDFYFQGAARDDNGSSVRFPHLHGAVRDVNRVERFLVQRGVPEGNIVKLTASYNPLSPQKPTETDQTKWPTHENIIRELNSIEKLAKVGWLVYIHFSGHGILRGKVSHEKTSQGGDSLHGVALATTDVLEDGGTYLTGYQLGQRLRGMTEVLGLRVTLVLDACYSGRGLRATTPTPTFAPRTIVGHHDPSSLKADKDADYAAEEHLARLSGTRQSVVKEDWLSRPVRCTVLTACGTNQTAGEDFFTETAADGEMTTNGKLKRGILTYWLLEYLKKFRGPSLPSYTAVQNYILNKIKTETPDIQQYPCLFGDKEFEFFGNKKRVERPACRVIEAWEDKFRLDVGSAQGVAEQAIYDIYPAEADPHDSGSSYLARQARVLKVEAFHSVAKLDSLREGEADPSDAPGVQVGSFGVLRSWALKDERRVRMTIDDVQVKTLFKSALETYHNLVLEPDSTENFAVTLDANGRFVISESTGSRWNRLQRLPAIKANSELAAQKLAHVLCHVTRYREIERLLYHPRSTHVQEDRFDLLFYKNLRLLEHAEVDGVKVFEVTENEELKLRVKYDGPAAIVWVALYELNPSWGIVKKLACKLSKGILEPDEYEPPIRFRTKIPPKTSESDSDDTADTFMAFIVEGEEEQSWDDILLEGLPSNAGDLRLDFDVKTRSYTRRAEFEMPRALPQRHWGVVSFVVHSSPPQE